ncbi:MAG: hypothetical protein EBR82_78965 [Caulobacteraceae bacterium]|nr:hypothetical protein [Caulobacteraceae bacterium]
MAMTADQVRSLERWLVKIHDYATDKLEESSFYDHRVQLSRVRRMALEALGEPNQERLERIREGRTDE